MGALSEIPVEPAAPERFRALLGEDYARIEEAIGTAGRVLDDRVVWHVNSTARGGGVAEMLHSLLGYARGAGVDARWLTIGGDGDFFRITKRIHNNLHSAEGDGGELGEAERASYEATLAPAAAELAELVGPGDIVYLHDPQTAGLIPAMAGKDVRVVWRCHIGIDEPSALMRRASGFLLPYVRGADACVFSRQAYVWEGLDPDRVWLVAPSIDAFSPKNQELDPEVVAAILAVTGIGPAGGGAEPRFTRPDGSEGVVARAGELDQEGPVPARAPLVLQVSRWDRLKDHTGVLRCFAESVRDPDAHLLLVGPSVAGVSDDPEGAEVLAEVRALRLELEPGMRARVHLASLPMEDVEENAAMVNAIQRRADVILQKSIAEGFGLTVAEAMWKSKPVVASRMGGIQDQIADGVSGLLVDPADLAAAAAAIDRLLADRELARRIGAAARERVRSEYLGTRHLAQYMELLEAMLDGDR